MSEIFPWPVTQGSQIRLDNVVRALAGLGEVDLFSFDRRRGDADPCNVPPDIRLRRVGTATAQRANAGFDFRSVARLATGQVPLKTLTVSWPELRDRFHRWKDIYDLVWFSRVRSFATLRPQLDTPFVVDFSDLEDYKTSGRVQAEVGDASRWNPSAVVSRIHGAMTARAWARLQQEVATEATAIAVCSELDRQRLGVENCEVLPNGYAVPEQSVGALEVATPPTILMQGALNYGPNVHGAQWLVRQVMPLLRRTQPDVQLRLVGRNSAPVKRLAADGVVVTGFVPDIVDELRHADIVAVPIFYGGGTRIKILEAFAHRIPVVSTLAGAEGLDVGDKEHLLIADSPEAFADACRRLLEDLGLRAHLADRAHEHFRARFEWSALRGRIQDFSRRVMDHPGRRP